MTNVEPGEYSISEYEVSKKLIHLLHGSLPRENDGAIEFWSIKDNLQKHSLHCHHWSEDKWKKSMAGGGGNKKRYQYCTDSSGTILSGRSLIDPTLQDNVVIPDGFFQYIYHVGCAINLHSIINSGLIPGGQILSNRQTVFFLSVDPMDKNHKDPDTIDLNEPRHAQYMHKTWKKHQNTVYWIDINLALKKGLKFCQTRSNAIILHETLPTYCIPKVVRMETGEIVYEKVFLSPRPPPKISLKHDWMKELGSEVARQPDGQVVRQSKSSQSSQSNPNPDHDRTVRPVVGSDPRTAPSARKTCSSQEIETRSFHEEAVKHDRTVKPVVCSDISHAQGASQTRSSDDSKNFNVGDETNHDRTGKPVVGCDASHEPGNEQSMLNSVDIDFRIPRLPHSVVKQAENSRVRELVKKIENHLSDNLFNEIYNKTKPTTRSVRRQRK